MRSNTARRAGHRCRGNDPKCVEWLEGRRLLSAYTPHVLAALTSNQVSDPFALVEGTGGNLFFLATEGSPADENEGVYELAAGSSTPTLLASIGNSGAGDLLADASGNLFGLTDVGGAHNEGEVWELPAGASTIMALAPFDTSTSGSAPQLGNNLVMDSSGDFFGTAQSGGSDGGGTVWELAHGANAITTLASFTKSISNNTPNGLTIDSSGNLFGTIGRDISVSGAHGAVWELPHGASTINVLASFNGTNGDSPNSPLYIDGSGNVFGEANAGGTGGSGIGDGVIWEIAAGSGTITDLASFTGANGTGPKSGVIADAGGDLFGVTNSGGGSSNAGVIFELPKGASTITALHTFTNISDGSGPNSLVMDASGDLFTTSAGLGPNGGGTVFELTPNAGGGGGGGGSGSLTGTISGKFPSSVIAGQKTSIIQTVGVTDSGQAAVSGTVGVKLFLATGTTVDANSIQLASASKSVKLKPHAHDNQVFRLASVPASAPNGTYHFVGEITDPTGGTTDVASSGTITVAPAQIDLTGAFSKTPVPKKGGKTVLSFSVSDIGNTPATGPLSFNVDTSADGLLADATVVTTLTKKINLKAGKSQKVSALVTLPTGTAFVVIQLDPSNAFQDINTTNNVFATSAQVTVA